jgi:uncharacterized low-complexity protein
MSQKFVRLATLLAVVAAAAGQSAQAASTASSNPFQVTELPGMSSGASALLAEGKCGSGSCGVKKEGDHHCATKKHDPKLLEVKKVEKTYKPRKDLPISCKTPKQIEVEHKQIEVEHKTIEQQHAH